MPRQCAICIDPGRVAFEAAVDGGLTVKAAALVAGLPYDTAKRHIRGHGRAPAAPSIPTAIIDTFERATSHAPMAWQREMLGETRDTLLVKGRQVGATEVASVLAIHVAMTRAGSTSAIISPSQRQSSEVTVRARLGLWALGQSLRQDSVSLLRLANGSRIISLPGSARGIRGYAADLVVLDEAAWISPETFTAARPLTAATGGRLIVQSTPGSPVGPFYDLAKGLPDGWASFRVRSDEVPTISPEFLELSRREMAADLFAQEYLAEFGHASVTSLFSPSQIDDLFAQKETA